jgi:hypothetical protein
LAEKAFAQANAAGWLNSGYPWAGDSYEALNTGSPTTVCAYLSALTGLQSSAWYVVSNGNETVGPSYVENELLEGKLVVVATGNNPASSYIVPDHCYALIGYNSSSSMPFEVYNPWGVSGLYYWDNHYVYGNTFICNATFLQENYQFWGVDSPTY